MRISQTGFYGNDDVDWGIFELVQGLFCVHFANWTSSSIIIATISAFAFWTTGQKI